MSRLSFLPFPVPPEQSLRGILRDLRTLTTTINTKASNVSAVPTIMPKIGEMDKSPSEAATGKYQHSKVSGNCWRNFDFGIFTHKENIIIASLLFLYCGMEKENTHKNHS